MPRLNARCNGARAPKESPPRQGLPRPSQNVYRIAKQAVMSWSICLS